MSPSPHAQAELRRLLREGKVMKRVYKRRLSDRPWFQVALVLAGMALVLLFWWATTR